MSSDFREPWGSDLRLLIDTILVRRLVDGQFPQWRDLPIKPVEIDGWDNRTFRLGEELNIRLPSAADYAPQVRKEEHCLPIVAAGVSLSVPEVVALGLPGKGYPFDWSVRRWIEGTPLRDVPEIDPKVVSSGVSNFLRELWSVDPTQGPRPGVHSAGRGGGLGQWDSEVDEAIGRLGSGIRPARARALWRDARDAEFEGGPVWFHGDVAVGNLLT